MLNRMKDIVYDLVLFFVNLQRSHKKNDKLAVIRLDEIGDYMLWRPVIRHLIEAERFKGLDTTLYGNDSWRSLYEHLDEKIFNRVIWINKKKFKSNLIYRFRILTEVKKEGFISVINPTYSRDKRFDDALVKAAAGEQVYGMIANLENVRPYELGYDKNLYNHLFHSSEQAMFELHRNIGFTEYIADKSIPFLHWQILQEKLPNLSFTLPDNYLVLFTGSRSKKRIWPTKNFVEIANYCQKKFGWTIVLCGGEADKYYANLFSKSFSGSVIDLCGNTKLTELLSILCKANLLVTVDTGSVHLAAAIGCKTIGIFNGSQYGRFSPYPSTLSSSIISVYPELILEELNNPSIVSKKYKYTVNIPYYNVNVQQVIMAINKLSENK